MLYAGYVWYYWLGLALFIGTVLAVVAVIIGYVVRVEAPKYRGIKQ
jgi:hypothetical protein